MTAWPAVCSRCGSIVVDTLWSDHTVPLYGCGSTPITFVCDRVVAPSSSILDRNALPLTALDIDELAELLGVASIAWAPE